MRELKIAIMGTRGIPNHYGGYEQAATFLATGLVQKGHAVTVYNSHNHPYRDKLWNGVEIVHCYDPENRLGTAGQFIYDLNCIRDARKKNYDVILQMGYTSSSIWGRLYPKNTVIISNMDGLEWKRDKYSAPVKRFLRYAERLAIKYSDYYIADSQVIQNYLEEKYSIGSRFIPYGAAIYNQECEESLNAYDLLPDNYFLLIARMEPENNIEMILNGFAQSNVDKKMVVIGNTDNKYGKWIKARYRHINSILFTGSIFNQQQLHSLRSFCCLYFHGHSVGGTNPSLLEAMASKALIAAHDNLFNKKILDTDAFYFSSVNDIKSIIHKASSENLQEQMSLNNFEKIKNKYTWETVTDQYENYILQCHNASIHVYEKLFYYAGFTGK